MSRPTAFALAVLLLACSAADPRPLLGAYRLDDGRLVSVRRSYEDTLIARVFETGEGRRLYPVGERRYRAGAGFEPEPVELEVEFTELQMRWAPTGDAASVARRIPQRAQEVRIRSGDVRLFARLTLPPGPGPHPAIVLVHGSGPEPATEFYYSGDFFTQNGIACLVFDKRGTGRSEGEYDMDFHELSDDVVAVLEWLSSQPGIDAARIGLAGYSQGGWISPLAASKTDLVSFVIVSYGMIDSPAEEARLETRQTMAKRGFDGPALDQIDELSHAAIGVVAQRFEGGWDELSAVERRYADAAWMDRLDGTFADPFVRWPAWLIRIVGPFYGGGRLPWYYDSVDVLERLDIPMVWLIAGEDSSAPNAFTLAELERLRAAGKPYQTLVFPDVDHGMVHFEEREGRRVPTHYAPEYFRTETCKALELLELPREGTCAAS